MDHREYCAYALQSVVQQLLLGYAGKYVLLLVKLRQHNVQHYLVLTLLRVCVVLVDALCLVQHIDDLFRFVRFHESR